jgi:hypothetical protein
MSFTNKRAKAKDRKRANPGFVSCSLLDISDYYSVGRVPPNWVSDKAITLYTNPQEITRSLTANYGVQNGLLTTSGITQYGFSERSPIKLTGLLIDTLDPDYDATPYLDQLEALTKPSLNTYPPVLAIVWGERVIQPVVLTNLEIVETAWSGGLVSKATTDLEFRYLPPISYRSANNESRLNQLTEREVDKAKKKAAEKIDKEAKDAAKPGDKPKKPTDPKTLKVDPKTGKVTQPETPKKPDPKKPATQDKPKLIATFTRQDLNA